MVVVAAPVQHFFGMWGVAATQIMLLLFAIGAALYFKTDLRSVFRIRRPSLRQVFGVLVIWVGGYLAVAAITNITFYFFPEIADVSNAMLDIFSSVSFPIMFLIIAVMPAICEEALHRGFLLYTFRNVNKWVTILALGAIFGFFHLDPYRFFITAFLGILLTYIAVETRNILLPILFHFVNNSLSAISTLFSAPITDIELHVSLATVGSSLFLAAPAPFIILAGSRLLRSKDANRNRPISQRTLVLTTIATVALVAVGMWLIADGYDTLLEAAGR